MGHGLRLRKQKSRNGGFVGVVQARFNRPGPGGRQRAAIRMRFDFIIVGAGMAGASLAYELSRSKRVCLVEAEPQPGVHGKSVV